jgi:hypothetical protein
MNRWMRCLVVAVVLAGCRCVCGAETNAPPKVKLSGEQVGELLQQAILLGRTGLYDEAELRCRKILEAQPDQLSAQRLLKEIQEKRKATGPESAVGLRLRLEKMVLPEVNVREAAPQDVIAFLQDKATQLSPKDSPVNFVWQVAGDKPLPKVTLSLRQVPLLDVIRYVMELTGLRYRVDAHAVVIYRPEPTPAAAKPNATAH